MKTRGVMVIGAVGSGKSSLLQALGSAGAVGEVLKTQAVVYGSTGIDTPGEYLESPAFNRCIIALSQDVRCVLMVQAADDPQHRYPPGFASVIQGKAVGVVTKSDIRGGCVERAKSLLHSAGVGDSVFVTSSGLGIGIEALREFVDEVLAASV